MSFALTIHKGRTSDDTVALYESDGTTALVLAATDVVRVKFFKRDGDTPDLDIDSAAASANGSVVTVDTLNPSSCTLRIAQGDTSGLVPGPYRAEILVVDDSESSPADAVKMVEMGVAYVLGVGGGDVGLA